LDGATISGRYRISLDASDASGVADVVMSIDEVVVGTDRRAPYWFVLDAKAYAAGSHELSFVATDTVGNQSTAASVTVTFAASAATSAGAGRVLFRSPANGASVAGDVTIQASVSDPDGLALLEWFVDGEPVFSQRIAGTSSGVSFLWRARDTMSGKHTITTRITDSFGNQTSGSLTLYH
jgi:hypothetical protein